MIFSQHPFVCWTADLSDPHGKAAMDPLGSDLMINKAGNRQQNEIVAIEIGVAAVIHWQVPHVGKIYWCFFHTRYGTLQGRGYGQGSQWHDVLLPQAKHYSVRSNWRGRGCCRFDWSECTIEDVQASCYSGDWLFSLIQWPQINQLGFRSYVTLEKFLSPLTHITSSWSKEIRIDWPMNWRLWQEIREVIFWLQVSLVSCVAL